MVRFFVQSGTCIAAKAGTNKTYSCSMKKFNVLCLKQNLNCASAFNAKSCAVDVRVGIKRRVAGGRYTFVIFKKVGKCVCIFKSELIRDLGNALTRRAKQCFGAFHGLIGNERADTLPVGFAK